jgi:hypothetical protein
MESDETAALAVAASLEQATIKELVTFLGGWRADLAHRS